MKKDTKLKLIIAGALEAIVIVFCIVVSIIIAATYPKDALNEAQFATKIAENGPFIGWFQQDRTRIFLVLILPMLILLAADIVYLVIFATKRESNLSEAEEEAIEERAKKEAREELMRELMAEEAAKEAGQEEAPAAEPEPKEE